MNEPYSFSAVSNIVYGKFNREVIFGFPINYKDKVDDVLELTLKDEILSDSSFLLFLGFILLNFNNCIFYKLGANPDGLEFLGDDNLF